MLGGHRSGDMKSGATCCSSSMISRARWAGTLSYWNV